MSPMLILKIMLTSKKLDGRILECKNGQNVWGHTSSIGIVFEGRGMSPK